MSKMKLLGWLEIKKWYIRTILILSVIGSVLIVHFNKDKGGIILSEVTLEEKFIFGSFIFLWLVAAFSFYLLVSISAFSEKKKSSFQRKWDKSFWVIFSIAMPFIIYLVGYKVFYSGFINS